MPVISLQLSQKPQHYESNLIETTIDNRLSFPDQFLQLKSNYRVAENLCIANFFFQIFAWQQILNLVGLIIYNIQIAFKISLSIHDCHSHWKKGEKKNDDDNIWVFGFEFVRDFSKKISLCVVFQRHLFLRGGELRATRECFKPRVTIAIGLLSLWLKCGWNPTELTSGFTLVT
jgi:hypothetical protein